MRPNLTSLLALQILSAPGLRTHLPPSASADFGIGCNSSFASATGTRSRRNTTRFSSTILAGSAREVIFTVFAMQCLAMTSRAVRCGVQNVVCRLYTTRAVRCQVLTWYMVVLQTTKGSLTRTRRKGRRGRTLSVSYELLYLLRSVYAVRSRLSYELCATVSGYASITRCPVLTSGVWYGRKRRNV